MKKEELAKPKRGRRTKAEIEQEFNALQKQEQSSKTYVNSKEEELVKFQEQEILESVRDVSSDEMIRKFADLNIEISKTLSSLSDKIANEINYLAKLRQVAELEKKEIERLHTIDVAKTALDQLLQDYEIQKDQLEEEISLQRTTWEEEQRQKEIESEEETEQLEKMRKREIDEYEYKKNLERKKAQDKYDEDLRIREKQNKDKQETLERNWQIREQALSSQEEELKELRKTVAEYPELLKLELERGVTEAIKRTELVRNQEIELLKRDAESERKIAELKIKSLEESLLRNLSQLSVMQTQVDEAKKQVQDIAVKAIEGASGSKTLQYAMDQVKNRVMP